MKTIILVVVLMLGDRPMRGDVYFGTDADECAKAKALAETQAKDTPFTVWAQCIPITPETKPQANPEQRDPKSEVKS